MRADRLAAYCLQVPGLAGSAQTTSTSSPTLMSHAAYLKECVNFLCYVSLSSQLDVL
jgi:hypothetical protein